MTGPCSACSDGDAAMKYHNHEPRTNLRPFPARVGIVISLDDLRAYMVQFVNEHERDEELATGLGWTFELFLQWLQRKRMSNGPNNESKGSAR